MTTTPGRSRPSCGCGWSSAGEPTRPRARSPLSSRTPFASSSTRLPRRFRQARREQIAGLILRDTVGLGPLEELLADDEVEEVMVNGHDSVYVERHGRIERTDVRFASEQALRDAIERILAPAGRRVDELNPMADARLADGSRINVVIPPLAVDGPALSVRRFAAERPGPG